MPQYCYVTKYALTTGIEKVKVISTSACGGYVKTDEYPWSFLKVGKDVFATKEEAITAATAMRDRKLASMRKQIAKLEKLSFSVYEEGKK